LESGETEAAQGLPLASTEGLFQPFAGVQKIAGVALADGLKPTWRRSITTRF
jgi:hypothetical protein